MCVSASARARAIVCVYVCVCVCVCVFVGGRGAVRELEVSSKCVGGCMCRWCSRGVLQSEGVGLVRSSAFCLARIDLASCACGVASLELVCVSE